MLFLSVLGREPDLSLAELKAKFHHVRQISPVLATFESDSTPVLKNFGGSLKFAEKIDSDPVKYLKNLPEGKITLGLSDYREKKSKLLNYKRILKRSVRLLPSENGVISTASAHHNQLGEKENRVELIFTPVGTFRSLGAQNISSYKSRDQLRPARDAKVGMLPPKLAQILINLCGPLENNTTIFDPFCGTGTVLQEALLMGLSAAGSDKNPKMLEYSKKNLEYLKNSPRFASEIHLDYTLAENPTDATADKFSVLKNTQNLAVASELYLGPPLSSIPSAEKLERLKSDEKSFILAFLKNLAPQIPSGTPLTLAVPAWLRENGRYSRLFLLDEIKELGYNERKLSERPLLYYREGQIVARDIILLRKV
ncbi:hypothetical protein IJG76_01795 [Candidatus Saccharibacteria bacterium]|nr:hypothetical protein [Candidatus Saccharibacteria bacterium]